MALAAAPAFAQSTSAGVGGTVVAADGQPVAGAEVVITHVESGTVSRAVTDANGNYSARGLRVGGPYTITVNKEGAGSSTHSDVYLSLNQVADVDATLNADVTNLGGVAVYADATADLFSSQNKGVGTSVDGRQLALAPQGNRSLDDIARLDPRIQVTDQASGAISVAGINNRYNTISVDGLSQGDPFGLNANGMPYVGSPISVDTIAAYDIKISDYDVTTDTVGATVNAVTKSGTNEFHGSVYYALKDASSMVGERNGEEYGLFDKDETKGITLGGPILKDKLFFFASYEEQAIKNFGGESASDGLANGDVTQDDIDQAISIANDVGMQPGVYGATGINLENKRYLAKLDWNINDFHRASLTYQQTEEFR
ncbi:TonB-dependent receptor, partial [Luteimonas weifangensis]